MPQKRCHSAEPRDSELNWVGPLVTLLRANNRLYETPDSVVQDHIEQRFMNPDATVVFDKAVVAKAVHEEADAGPSGADHFRQGFLGDRWNQRFRFSRLTKLRQQQESSGQALFAGVEKLIDKIGLGSHTAGPNHRRSRFRSASC